MRAVQLAQASKTLTIRDVPVPDVGPREVLVRIKACGICLSDVHIIDGSMPSPLDVVIPGHEPAGVIEQVGAEVPHWRVGDRVVIDAGRSCGVCLSCVSGLTESCAAPKVMGFDYDGAWAEFIAVPFTGLCAIPDELPFEQAALLADAVSTPYAALVDTAGLRPGQSVGLWGIGGLGFHAVQIAHIAGAAPIIAVDPREAARSRALLVGADLAIDPRSPRFLDEIYEVTGGGLDVAVDLVGSNGILRQAQAAIARGGQILVVGLGPDDIHLGTTERFGVLGHQLKGHLGYRRRHLQEVVKLVKWGRLDLAASVSAVIPLEDAPAGVAALASKSGDPIRIVIAP
jgi:D-arabinose 1-dehydrogenase-like Zn-dependent alcohol dehydrogenase